MALPTMKGTTITHRICRLKYQVREIDRPIMRILCIGTIAEIGNTLLSTAIMIKPPPIANVELTAVAIKLVRIISQKSGSDNAIGILQDNQRIPPIVLHSVYGITTKIYMVFFI